MDKYLAKIEHDFAVVEREGARLQYEADNNPPLKSNQNVPLKHWAHYPDNLRVCFHRVMQRGIIKYHLFFIAPKSHDSIEKYLLNKFGAPKTLKRKEAGIARHFWWLADKK